jgi:hypothetical protein
MKTAFIKYLIQLSNNDVDMLASLLYFEAYHNQNPQVFDLMKDDVPITMDTFKQIAISLTEM